MPPAAAVQNMVLVIAGLFTAVVISVGMAAGEVTLLGWLRRFLPERSYADIAALERAIALSFGGFIRGRGLVGLIFGTLIAIAALLIGVPYAPLIAVIAGLIQFIPFIGPLLGWAVLPAFALVVAPSVVGPALVVSLLISVVLQLIVTRMVMGRAVHISVAAVLAVVMLGTAIAGVMGAIFADPDGGGDPGHHGLPAEAGRPVASIRRRPGDPARRPGGGHDGLTATEPIRNVPPGIQAMSLAGARPGSGSGSVSRWGASDTSRCCVLPIVDAPPLGRGHRLLLERLELGVADGAGGLELLQLGDLVRDRDGCGSLLRRLPRGSSARRPGRSPWAASRYRSAPR